MLLLKFKKFCFEIVFIRIAAVKHCMRGYHNTKN
jgi:hypothetical protein